MEVTALQLLCALSTIYYQKLGSDQGSLERRSNAERYYNEDRCSNEEKLQGVENSEKGSGGGLRHNKLLGSA